MRAYRHVAVVSQAQRRPLSAMKRLLLSLIGICVLTACSLEPRHVPNPLLLPGQALQTAAQNAVYNRRRGAVEFFVKDNHPRLMAEIERGGGPYLDEAMAMAKVPPASREALKLDLRGDRRLYASSPDALVVTLMVYGP